MARKSEYDTKVKPHLEDIKKWVKSGATVEEVAKALHISPTTLYKYQREIPEIKEVFMRARVAVCCDIKAALLKKALGFEYTEERRTGRKDKNGEQVILVEKYTRYCVPSETAAAMLLRNYDSEWLDNDNTSVNLKKQKLDLDKAIAEANNFDLDFGETKGNEKK